MKVVLLAGGFGTRYLELTKKIPKPLINVGNKPIIFHLMRHFVYYGHSEFIICCGYKYNLLYNYFANEFSGKKKFHLSKSKNYITISFIYLKSLWNIKLVNTGLNTQTGGRINKIRNFLHDSSDENFFLSYADGLSNINLDALKYFHKNKKSDATVTIVKIKNQYGVVNIKRDIVKTFSEKPNNPYYINGGFFILNKKILKFTKYDNDIWESDCIPRIMKKNTLYAYKHTGFWQSMDNFHDKIKLDKYLKNNFMYFLNE